MARCRLAGAAKLACGEVARVDVAGVAVCVVHTEDDAFFAVDDTCSHEDASLSEGWMYDHEIECPRHNSIFDLKTGEPVSLPATEPIGTYDVMVEGDDLLIAMPGNP